MSVTMARVRLLGLGLVVVGGVCVLGPGCTPDGSGLGTYFDVDGGSAVPDASTIDGAAADGGTPDAESGAICVTDNAPCSNGGLCEGGQCASCADNIDDPNCTAAYGGADQPFICLGGVCSAGNCRTSADCAAHPQGALCGIAQPNQCGKCTADAQCAAINAATPVCNTASGLCVASANSCSGTLDNTACPINAGDVCCTSACAPGNCCPGVAGDTLCKTKLSNSNAICGAGKTCTTCDAVSGLTFIVDPVGGKDDTATGSAQSGGTATPACAFKTITGALKVIGPYPTAGTVIQVRNTGAVSAGANGETFPIIVTQNVVITATGGLVNVNPPPNAIAFTFASAGSGIDGTLGGGSISINGGGHTATSGIFATTGSAATIQNVTVKNFAGAGIRVANAGVLTIRGGVAVSGNGTVLVRRSGLMVGDTAHADIIVPNGTAATTFNGNTQNGIQVAGRGSVTLQGAHVGTVGTVEASANAGAGLAIAQTPGSPLPLNAITGLVTTSTTAGSGIRIEAGSKVTLRDTVTLAHTGNGLLVATSVIGNSRNNVLATIDLGTAADPGGNVFQASANGNRAAGVCLQVDPGSGNLSARGNIFSGPKNCATAAAALSFDAKSCGGGRDLGLSPSLRDTKGNDIDVAMCTHP
jgi:hypothetical protein